MNGIVLVYPFQHWIEVVPATQQCRKNAMILCQNLSSLLCSKLSASLLLALKEIKLSIESSDDGQLLLPLSSINQYAESIVSASSGRYDDSHNK
jgi:hypothetical protein